MEASDQSVANGPTGNALDAAGVALTILWELVEERRKSESRRAASFARQFVRYWDLHEKLLNDSLLVFNRASLELGQPYIQIGETAGRSAYDVIVRLGRSFRSSWRDSVTDTALENGSMAWVDCVLNIERTLRTKGDVDRLFCQLIDEGKKATSANEGRDPNGAPPPSFSGGSNAHGAINVGSAPPAAQIGVVGNTVIVDGTEYAVEPHLAKWVEVLVEARSEGAMVTGAELNAVAGRNKNVSRELAKLRRLIPKLSEILKSKNGKGGGWYLSR